MKQSEESNDDFRSKEFIYAVQFDTIQILKKSLTRNYVRESEYPIKDVDVNTLFLIGIFPGRPMSFYSYKLNLENGSFNYIAKKIESLGLVEIVPDSTDKRKKVFILTEKGEKELVFHRKRLNAHIEERLAILSEEERELFIDSLNCARSIAKKLLNGDMRYE